MLTVVPWGHNARFLVDFERFDRPPSETPNFDIADLSGKHQQRAATVGRLDWRSNPLSSWERLLLLLKPCQHRESLVSDFGLLIQLVKRRNLARKKYRPQVWIGTWKSGDEVRGPEVPKVLLPSLLPCIS